MSDWTQQLMHDSLIGKVVCQDIWQLQQQLQAVIALANEITILRVKPISLTFKSVARREIGEIREPVGKEKEIHFSFHSLIRFFFYTCP